MQLLVLCTQDAARTLTVGERGSLRALAGGAAAGLWVTGLWVTVLLSSPLPGQGALGEQHVPVIWAPRVGWR